MFTDILTWAILTWALSERAIARIGRGWLTRDDRAAWEQLRAELADNEQFAAALDRLWPILTPQELLTSPVPVPERLQAVGAPQTLLRVPSDPWTVSDVPLLDELVDLLGYDQAAAESAEANAERERNYEAEYAAGVLDLMVAREDLMDDEDHLIARDVIHAEALADRFVERDTRELADRAAADRDWTYRHIVVDEAQELSEMDWRVLMRRCPGRSFTVVGDLRSVARRRERPHGEPC